MIDLYFSGSVAYAVAWTEKVPPIILILGQSAISPGPNLATWWRLFRDKRVQIDHHPGFRYGSTVAYAAKLGAPDTHHAPKEELEMVFSDLRAVIAGR